MIVAVWTALGLLLAGLLAYISVTKRSAYRQQSDQVVIRRPGQRMFGPPEPLAVTGREDFPFALLSQAAYQRKGDAKKAKDGECLNADAILKQLGWQMWDDLGSVKLREQMKEVHLRAEVWWHVHDRKIAVAFGGTVFTNLKDWKANLRWFLPHHEDQYTLIVDGFGRAFEEEYAARVTKAGWPPFERVHLFSTGHSLGGGLAQEFAYSLPLTPAVPRIEKVYAFDPSPVTGFYSVQKKVREVDVRNLDIDRIFERGEILALVRSIVSLFVPPRKKDPTIRQIRYDLFLAMNPITGHSITEFAYWLDKRLSESHNGNTLSSPAVAAG